MPYENDHDEFEFYTACQHELLRSEEVWKDLEIADTGFGPIDFMGCKFVKCKFTRMDFRACDMEAVEFHDCEFVECKFDTADMSQIECSETSFYDCSFDEVSFYASVMEGVSFTDCKGDSVDFSSCMLGACFFYSKFKEADFTDTDLTNSWIGDCDLSRATFEPSTDVSSAIFERCNITDTFLCEAGGFSENTLGDCVVLPFKMNAAGEVLNSLVNTGTKIGKGLLNAAEKIKRRTRSGVNVSIYGYSKHAHLYCSNVELYRKLVR